MAQSKRFFDDIKNQLECSVCQEQFSDIKEPKILKCLHTFCKTCLEAWLRQQREATLSCPTCRQVTECSNNNIDTLPSNLFCKQLVEIVEAYSGQGPDDSQHCGNCDVRKSLKFYCSDCNSLLCDDCTVVHKKGKIFRGHHVKEIGNFESSDMQDYARRANICKKHKDEVRFYCEKCQICICRDCAILEHQDHNKISLDQGLDNNKSEIETKMRAVQENGCRLRNCRDSLEKRKLKLNGNIEEATKEVKRVAQRCMLLIRQHEASVTERLVVQKATFQDTFDTQMSSLDGKLMEIDSTLAFSEDVFLRRNLPEILNVKAMMEQRLQELAEPFDFMSQLDCSGLKYVQNDVSFLKDAPGKLVVTNTEPSLSVAEGKSLTNGFVGEDCTFTVITKSSAGQTTYSEIDEISVKIIPLSKHIKNIKTVMTDLKDGRYSISYRPTTPGEFTVYIEVAGNPIMESPFELNATTRSEDHAVQVERPNQFVSSVVQHKQEFEGVVLTVRPFLDKMVGENDQPLELQGIKINREKENLADNNGGRKKPEDNEDAVDVDPPEYSKGGKNPGTRLETYLGKVKVSVYKGDITNERVDVIVNAANKDLDHFGGVAKAILDKGGKTIKKESLEIIKKRRELKDGDAVATSSGRLPCKVVVHAVGPKWYDVGSTNSRKLLHRACLNSLCETEKRNMTSIALPAIGSGIYGMPKDVCAEVMFDTVEEFVRQGDAKKKKITDIRFVNIDDPSVQAFRKEFNSRYGNDRERSSSKKASGGGTASLSPTGAEGGGLTLPSSTSNHGRGQNRNDPDNRRPTNPNDAGDYQHHPTYFDDPLSSSSQFSSSNASYSSAVKRNAGDHDKRHPMPQSHEGKGGFSLPPNGGDGGKTDKKEEENCPICLDTMTNPRVLRCKHVFCPGCLQTALDVCNKCPVCQEPQGALKGNQPRGEMKYRVDHYSVPGYGAYRTIVIDYHFPSGVQGREHPHPGQYYNGTSRTGYLPDTREGREVLHLLRRAFDARLVFTVGTSNTTGISNQVIWNDIHHKTSLSGGPFQFGYPDPDYLRRVKEELAAKGIR